jgi:hypothetical protein
MRLFGSGWWRGALPEYGERERDILLSVELVTRDKE